MIKMEDPVLCSGVAAHDRPKDGSSISMSEGPRMDFLLTLPRLVKFIVTMRV